MKTFTTAALLAAALVLTGCSTPDTAKTAEPAPQPEAKRETCARNLSLQVVGAKPEAKPADAGRTCVKHS